jgi:hypothetical protein
MRTAAVPVWRLQLPSRARLTARLPDFLMLMKPNLAAEQFDYSVKPTNPLER